MIDLMSFMVGDVGICGSGIGSFQLYRSNMKWLTMTLNFVKPVRIGSGYRVLSMYTLFLLI